MASKFLDILTLTSWIAGAILLSVDKELALSAWAFAAGYAGGNAIANLIKK